MKTLKFIFKILFHHVFLQLIAAVVLIPATFWATLKDMERLPWGLNSIFGNEEDGWNGNGVDPNNPRKFWTAPYWHKYTPNGKQGWWPDYLKIDWNKTSFLKRWWLAYQWCAIRNLCWNLRLRSWFGINIHYKHIQDSLIIKVDKNTGEVKADWEEGFYRKKKIGNKYLVYGYEFYYYVHDKEDYRYNMIRKDGYYGEYKYKIYSIPSIRIKDV